MGTQAGVGRSTEKDSFAAGAAAAAEAMARAGVPACDFVLLFSTIGYDQSELLRGVRSVTGAAPLAGCSGEGIITQEGPEGEVVFDLSGPRAGIDVTGVMVFASDEIRFTPYVEEGLRADSRKAGEGIGRKIAAGRTDDALFLLSFLDGRKANVKEFFCGLEASAHVNLPCIGALAGDNFILGTTYQYCNDSVYTDTAVCLLASGSLKFEIGISHGCVPIGLEKTITKAKGNTVYEIDDRPVWDFFLEYLEDKTAKFTREVRTFLDLGIRLPDELASGYDDYIIRAPLSQNPDGSLNFATEIREGTKCRIIIRDAEKISLGSRAMAERLLARLGGKNPVAVIHIDCAARGRMYFGKNVKEKGIDVMQDVFGRHVPWLGLYSCGEIGPIGTVNCFHNQTAVLCALYR